jgi:hypothetical protein
MVGVVDALSGAVVTASAMLRRNLFGVVSAARRGAPPEFWTRPRLVGDPDCVDIRTRNKMSAHDMSVCRSSVESSSRYGLARMTSPQGRLDMRNDLRSEHSLEL